MPAALSIVFPLALAGVLVASGLAKLRTPDTLDGWRDMGIPTALRRPALLTLHPWGELLLAVALAVLGGWLGTAAAAVALPLMLAYLVMVIGVVRKGVDTSCACFGESKPVTWVTVVRNTWYVALAVGATVVAHANPLFGGALAELVRADVWWAVAAVITAVTVAVTLWPTKMPESVESQVVAAPGPVVAASAGTNDDELLDYLPARTPAVPVTQADGTEVNLRTLTMAEPTLLLKINPGCAPCVQVLSHLPEWRELLPEVAIRLLLATAPETSKVVELEEPQSLHDPNGYVSGSLDSFERSPSAVLLGGNGLVSGGPVSGYPSIVDFVDDIYESLHGERPQH